MTKTRIKNVGVQYRCDKHDPNNKWFVIDSLAGKIKGGKPVRSCHKCGVPGCNNRATRWSGEPVYQLMARRDREHKRRLDTRLAIEDWERAVLRFALEYAEHPKSRKRLALLKGAAGRYLDLTSELSRLHENR